MNYMDYQTFLTFIKEHISDYFEDIPVSQLDIIKNIKNNGVVKEELYIQAADSKYGSVIDLWPFYQKYLAGSDENLLLEEISDTYFRNMIFPDEHLAEHILNFSEIKEDIFLKAVNYEANQEVLSVCPYVRQMDLALTFRIRIRCSVEGIMSVQVTQKMMESWQISKEVLYDVAMENTVLEFPSVIKRVIPMDEEHEMAVGMYVLTNEQGINGAVAAFYPGVLRKFAEEIDGDFYLLPSSIHEMILVPYDEDFKPEALKLIVEDVNRTAVSREEKLGNHVYFYCKDTDLLTISA